MKLLVTGGAGFIGANFILYWLEKYPDDYIVNFDKLTYAGNLESLKSVADNPRYSFVKGDICEASAVDPLVTECDVIVHFAAESHVDRSISGPAVFVKTNVIGTQVLLDAAVKHKKRFHHISTDEVFGSLSLDSTEKFNESTRYDPHSPYSASKASSDHFVRAYHTTYGLPVTISNCSNNYGPFMFPETFIPLTIINAMQNKKVPVYGDGLYVRDWLYVTDHCRAVDMIIQQGTIGETYCIGGLTDDINNLSVVKKILHIMGKDESLIEFVKDRPGHDRRYAVDWSKMKRDLGWAPAHDFDTYLEKTVEWYRNNEGWWKKLV